MSEMDDTHLVRAFCQGEEAAFASLVGKYQKPIFNLIYGMLNHYEDARDLTQQAFAKAAAKIHQFDQRYRFFSWLYRIAVNETLNFLERAPRFEPIEECHSPGQNPERQVMAEEFESHLRQALVQLPAPYRAVVLLKHIDDCSYREISEILRIPESTVKSRLFVARRMLWESLKERGVLYSHGQATH